MTVEHNALTGSQLHEPKGAAAATAGQIIVADGSGGTAWETPSFQEALSATTDNGVVRFDGTAGTFQDSGVTIDDSNNVTIPGSCAASAFTEDGTALSSKYALAGPKVFKDADEAVNNSATLQDDDDIVSITLDASTDYFFHGQLVWDSADGSTGFKFAFSLVSGSISDSALHLLERQSDSNGGDIQSGAITDTYTIAMGSPGGTNKNMVIVNGVVSTTNASELKLQWAQDVAATTNTTLSKGSYFEFHK